MMNVILNIVILLFFLAPATFAHINVKGIALQNYHEKTEFLKTEVNYLRVENANKEKRISTLEADNALFKQLWRQGQKDIKAIKEELYRQCNKYGNTFLNTHCSASVYFHSLRTLFECTFALNSV